MHKAIAVLLCLLSLSAAAQKPQATDVRFEIQPDPTGKVLVNWSLTNNSKLAVYVYDFFLWGPGHWNEQSENRTVLGTARRGRSQAVLRIALHLFSCWW
jgi:hypothetical protein